jgi:hypothetical protein
VAAQHAYRGVEMQEHFNGELEIRTRPRAISVEEQLQHAVDYEAWKARGNRDSAHGDPSKLHGCKRRSILFALPYWKVTLYLFHSHAVLLLLRDEYEFCGVERMTGE